MHGWVARSFVVASVAFAMFVGAPLTACTSLDGLSGGASPEPRARDGGSSGDSAACGGGDLSRDHANCGACGNVCGAMEHCLAGSCAPGCPDHAVYVSADGNDNNGGCTTDAPKRTIGAALALLKTLAAEAHEVRVCRGSYSESVVLDYPASLAGGYECTTWKRSAGYGSPTFDGVNETVVTGGADAAIPPLTVSKVTGVVVDGITFRAKDTSGPTRSRGALVSAAKVTFSSTKITAGGGEITGSPASVGLLVEQASDVTFDRSIAEGGSGRNTGGGYGSAGIFLASREANIRVTESRIDGGSGRVASGSGSVGLYVSEGKLTNVERSTISGGKGRTEIGSATYGLLYFASGAGADIDIIGNAITGGSGSCPSCATTGVAVSTKGRVRVHGNRISGGDIDPDVAGEMSFDGLRLTDFANADIQNNFVFSGNATSKFTSGDVTAITLERGATALVANNTIGLGPTSTNKGTAVQTNTPDVTFVDNVFFHAGTTFASAVGVDACSGSRSYRLRNNLWFGFRDASPIVSVDAIENGACTKARTVATRADTLASVLGPTLGAGGIQGNLRVAGACGTDTKCTAVSACTSGPACLPTLLAGWDAASAGGLFEEGWKLRDGVACTIAKGGATIAGLSPTDLYGATRTDPRSLGAHEQDGACQ